MAPEYMSVKALAERWGCSREVLYRQISSGRVPALRIGHAIRIPIAAVEQFERTNTTGGQA